MYYFEIHSDNQGLKLGSGQTYDHSSD